jgi:hypothetical protein
MVNFVIFEDKKSEFFLPIVFTPVLHRILPQVENILTGSIAKADAEVIKNLRRVILRELFNFRDFFKFYAARNKTVLKKFDEGALSRI